MTVAIRRLSAVLLTAWLGVGNAAADLPFSRRADTQARRNSQYAMVGEDTGVDGMLPIKAEGIGLVVGLRNTGSDPPPNRYRELMLEQMRKREVENPTQILKSDETALVLLRAFIPPGAREGDMIDVEVWVPPGDTTSSLKGGFLLEASLFENMIANSRTGPKALQGRELVRVAGPLLVAESPASNGDTAGLRKGRILGRGRVLDDRNFRIVLPRDNRSGVRSKQMAHRINQRFFSSEDGRKVGLATAKDDKIIELKLAKPYRYDIQRFLLVVRRIPASTSETFQEKLLEELRSELFEPALTLEAGLRLEAVGKAAIPVLKDGLASKSEAVRFSSAQALAYLGDSSGVHELGRLAEASPEYRPYALTALVAVNHPVSRKQLARLLNTQGAETRYGAFRALWAYDPLDPLVQGENLNDQFHLHVVPSTAEPMVHVSRNFRYEIVVFDGQQQLLPPFSLKAGEFILLNASAEGGRVHVAKFQPTAQGVVKQRTECSLNLAEILRETAKLGASYAEIVELLQQAQAGGNLQGRLEVNALPKTLRLEALDQMARQEATSGMQSTATAPSLFQSGEEQNRRPLLFSSSERDSETETKPESDVSKKRKSFWNLFRRSAN